MGPRVGRNLEDLALECKPARRRAVEPSTAMLTCHLPYRYITC